MQQTSIRDSGRMEGFFSGMGGAFAAHLAWPSTISHIVLLISLLGSGSLGAPQVLPDTISSATGGTSTTG